MIMVNHQLATNYILNFHTSMALCSIRKDIKSKLITTFVTLGLFGILRQLQI